MASSLRGPTMALSALAIVGGCHLIGGVHDLDYSGSGGSTTGGGGTGAGNPGGGPQGGGGEGGNTGGGGSDCALGDACDDQGVCDGAGTCTTGTVTNARMFGTSAADEATAMAATDGGLYVGMHIEPQSMVSMDLGNAGSFPTEIPNAILAKLNPTTLEPIWAHRLSDTIDIPMMPFTPGERRITALAARSDGVVVGGHYNGWLKIPGLNEIETEVSPIEVPLDGFVAFVDADGMGSAPWLWSNSVSDTLNEKILAVAANEEYVAALGLADGSGSFTFASTTINAGDAFLLLFDAGGAPLEALSWDCGFLTENDLGDVAFDSSGRLWVAGTYRGSCTIDNTMFSANMEAGPAAYVPFIARLDINRTTDSFMVADVQEFATTPAQGHALRLHPTSQGMLVAGDFHNGMGMPLSFPGGITLFSNSNTFFEPFLVLYETSAALEPLWAIDIDESGNAGPRPVRDIAADANDNALLSFALQQGDQLQNAAYSLNATDPEATSFKFAGPGADLPGGVLMWWGNSGITGADDQVALEATSDGVFGFGHGEGDGMYGAEDAMSMPTMNLGATDVVIYRRDP